MLVAKKMPYAKSYYDQQRQRNKAVAIHGANSRLAMTKLVALGMVLVVALTAVSLLAHFVLVVRVNYEIGRAASELSALHEEQQHLKIQIASLLSPERMERIALEEIGLQYPEQNQFIILTAGNLEVGD